MDDRERITAARRVARRDAFRRMTELGLTQGELADRAGVAYKTISRFFNSDGWREPAVNQAIATALGWPADELERIVDREIARDQLDDLETRVPGVLVLELGEHVLDGLTADELREIRATLRAVTLQHVAQIRARTPGRGFPLMTGSLLAGVGA